MAFCRGFTGGIIIVKQTKIIGKLMLVGCHIFSINTKFFIASSLWHVSIYLVVCFIFFNDIYHMFKYRWLSNPFRQRFWSNIFSWTCICQCNAVKEIHLFYSSCIMV